ncbi:MAG: MarR family transcriptional regulator [Ponticaulis sp.]|nr:MarR family transcriptional regulator [Ponticaulis sp.]|tara:strand:- start:4937 stop:5311 length:375 start_codon:yes stop_codon:yes gene_type:complete
MARLNTQDALEIWCDVTSDIVSGDWPDLTLRQQAILMQIYLKPQPHTVRGLAKTLNITKPAVTRAIDTLSALELVRRKKDDADLRNVLLQRTVKGSVFLSEFSDLFIRHATERGIEGPENRAAA